MPMNLFIFQIMVEGDSLSAIRWASESCKGPWRLENVVEDDVDLARHLDGSFF